MTVLSDPKAIEDLEAEALIREARRLRRRRWLCGSAVAALALGGIAGGIAATGGSSGGTGFKSAGSSASPPREVLALLDGVPAPLRSAVLQTIDAKSFWIGRPGDEDVRIYNAPNKLGPPVSDLTKCPSNSFDDTTATGVVIIGSTAYLSYETCPAHTYSVKMSPVPVAAQYGMSQAQTELFREMIDTLNGASKFTRTSSGYTYYGGATRMGTIGLDPSTPVTIQIQKGYVTEMVVSTRVGSSPTVEGTGAVIKVPTTFTDFDLAPKVELPAIPKKS